MAVVRVRTPESTAAWRPLPAARAVFSIALVATFVAALAGGAAQETVYVQRDGEFFFNQPGGTRLGRLTVGARLGRPSAAARSGHTSVTLEGWVFGASLRAERRDGHTVAVDRSPEENLRASPNGRVLARLVYGCLLDEVERRGQWVRVRRTGWVASGALGTGPVAAELRADSPPAPQTPPAAQEVDPGRAVVRRRLQLFRAPEAVAAGTLEAGVPVRVTARAGEWVRVEVQGWVRDNQIRLSDEGILTDVTAAELRATPDQYRGKLLRWTIQFLALQTADDLRPDFTPGQRYILARGPAPEYAFVYVVVPADRLADVARLDALASVTILARVRNGRSAYLANPILELVDLSQ